MSDGDIWTDKEKREVVAAYRRGSRQPPCPNDDEAVDVDEQAYVGGEVIVGFACPKCGARAEWRKKANTVV